MPKRDLSNMLPEPERASATVIEDCRRNIEGRVKKVIRRCLLPILKRLWHLDELGEGFHWPRDLRIAVGAGSKIGRFAYIGKGFECAGPIVVGDLCMIAAGVHVFGADHRFDCAGTPTRLGFPREARPITIIGLDVWIGRDVLLREGVTIGAGSVIASGAVVTKDVKPYDIVAGTPARVLRKRFSANEIAAHDATIRCDISTRSADEQSKTSPFNGSP